MSVCLLIDEKIKKNNVLLKIIFVIKLKNMCFTTHITLVHTVCVHFFVFYEISDLAPFLKYSGLHFLEISPLLLALLSVTPCRIF